MKNKMILAALLAIPLGTLLAEEYGIPTSPEGMSSMPVSAKPRMYDQQVSEEIMGESTYGAGVAMPGTIGNQLSYEQEVISVTEPRTSLYDQQVSEETIGESTYGPAMPGTIANQLSYEQEFSAPKPAPKPSASTDATMPGKAQSSPMYDQQVVEEYVEGGAVVGKSMAPAGMTAEQRAAHAELMKEVKQTSGKKPSQVATQKKKTTGKTTTKKTTPAKKSTVKDKKATTTKKATAKKEPAKKAATTKTAKNGKLPKKTKKVTA